MFEVHLIYAIEDSWWVKNFEHVLSKLGIIEVKYRDHPLQGNLDVEKSVESIYANRPGAPRPRPRLVVCFVSEHFRQTRIADALKKEFTEDRRPQRIFVPIMLDNYAKAWWVELCRNCHLVDLSVDSALFNFTDAYGKNEQVDGDNELLITKIVGLALGIRDVMKWMEPLPPVGAAPPLEAPAKSEPARGALDQRKMAEVRHSLRSRTVASEPISADLVDFSIFAPSTAAAESEVFVQVALHLAGELPAARERALEIDDSATLRGTSTLEIPIANGSTVTLMLAADGSDLSIDRPTQSVTWSRRLVAINFLVKVPDQPKTIFPVVRVACNGALAGEMRFKLDVVARSACASESTLQSAECKRYQRVFFSYSANDRARVLQIAQAYRILGVSFFQDILNFAPGQRWEKGLYKEIDSCDLFLLFWSYVSSCSDWVEKEVLYALERQEQTTDHKPEIVPFILDGPPPPRVPLFLRHLHFDDWMRYAVARV